MKKQYNSPKIYFENLKLNVSIAACSTYETVDGGIVLDEDLNWILFFDIDGNPCTSTPQNSAMDGLWEVCYHPSIVDEVNISNVS